MIPSNPEAEKALRLLPEGTPVTVNGISGKLVFQFYPERYKEVQDVMHKYVMATDPYYEDYDDAVEDAINHLINVYQRISEEEEDYEPELYGHKEYVTPTENEVHLFYRYYDAYEFGIAYKQEEDFNVEPRDYSQGTIPKGTDVVCYSYPAEEYTIINK
jgi:hypothetical protein